MFPILAVTAAVLTTPDPLLVERDAVRALKPPPFTLRIPKNPTPAEMLQYGQAVKKYDEALLKYTDALLEYVDKGTARSKAIQKQLQEQADREKQEKLNAEKADKPKP